MTETSMAADKHTEGPWTFDGPEHNIIVWGPVAEQRVCFMTSDGPALANARLIAAAPDMLAALKRAEHKLTAYVGVCKGDKELTDTVLPMVTAAIAKATA